MQEATTAAPEASGPTRATLFLRDVGASVNADVYHRGTSKMTVRRDLPFLRVGADVVDDEGRAATIASVRVYVEADVPTLILDLRYADPGDASGPRRTAPPPPRDASRGEATMIFGTERDALPRVVSTPMPAIERLEASVRRTLGALVRFARTIALLFTGDERFARDV